MRHERVNDERKGSRGGGCERAGGEGGLRGIGGLQRDSAGQNRLGRPKAVLAKYLPEILYAARDSFAHRGFPNSKLQRHLWIGQVLEVMEQQRFAVGGA